MATYVIYKCNGGKPNLIATNDNKKTLMQIVYNEAKANNYGIFRRWEIDGVENYDCGVITYCITTFEKFRNLNN